MTDAFDIGGLLAMAEENQQAVKQATEVAESNFNTAAANAVNAAKTATKKR